MLDYARARAAEAMKLSPRAVLATNGPAGLLAGEFPCEAAGLSLYLLVPRTSDHLFNLEENPDVTLLAAGWEMSAQARIFNGDPFGLGLSLLDEPGAEWYALVCIEPVRMQIRRPDGWGTLETIDLSPPSGTP